MPSSCRTASDVRLPLADMADQIAMGGLLTALAGFVDAIGYIGLGGLFASFMSGASVSLGVGLGDGQWSLVHQGALMIGSFLGGVAVATVLASLAEAWRLPAVLLLEALLLAGGALLANSGWPISTSILPLVAAMGVQNTVMQPVDGVRLGATFITGTLVSLGKALGQTLSGRARPWQLGGHALLCGTLVAGAAAGATLHGAFGPMALTVAAALVASLAMLSAVPVLARTQSHPARPRECRRHCDPEPDHPQVWPYY